MIIPVYKPLGASSHQLAAKIGQARNEKATHTGTLDPMATGLLIVATGKKTKELSKYQNLNKTYTGTFWLGKTSASMDTETECIDHPISGNINEELIISVRDEFLGETEQLTPM